MGRCPAEEITAGEDNQFIHQRRKCSTTQQWRLIESRHLTPSGSNQSASAFRMCALYINVNVFMYIYIYIYLIDNIYNG